MASSDRLALALEQRVGGDGGAHLHRSMGASPSRIERRDARDGGVLILLGLSDRSLRTCTCPPGARATISVNVPPRSIEKDQRVIDE
jgi:hypothetical protein